MTLNEDAKQLLDTFSALLNALKHRPVIEDAHAKHLSPAKQMSTSRSRFVRLVQWRFRPARFAHSSSSLACLRKLKNSIKSK